MQATSATLVPTASTVAAGGVLHVRAACIEQCMLRSFEHCAVAPLHLQQHYIISSIDAGML
jgi:hypothetical protein